MGQAAPSMDDLAQSPGHSQTAPATPGSPSTLVRRQLSWASKLGSRV